MTIADATVTGSLSYGDDVLFPCAVGSAGGSVTVAADDLHTFGTYQAAPLPRLVSGFTATFGLEWTRAGTILQLAVRNAVVTLDVVGLGPVQVVSTGQGEGIGDFIVSDADAPPGCVDDEDATAAGAIVTGRVSVFEDRLPSVPTLLEPADGSTWTFGQPEVFRVNATDPDGDPYRARVTIYGSSSVAAQFETRLVPSGVDSTGRPISPLPPGLYSWSAEAIDIRGGRGPVSVQKGFEVTAGSLALVPGLL